MPPEAATTTDVVVDEVTSLQALEELRPAWAALWRRCPSATPFQSPAWLIPWWCCFGDGELYALALRREGRLIGLAPLFIHTGQATSARAVRLMGTGNTDYLDALFAPGAMRASTEALFGFLERGRQPWEVCDFRQLRPASPLLEAPAPAGWADDIVVQDACPTLSLSGRGEDVDACIPESFLKKLRYYRRRTEREHAVDFECAEEPHEAEELLEALVRLHRARWAERDETGVLAGEAVQQFHRQAVEGLLAGGLLRLYALRLDGQIAAVYYGFTGHGRACYYLSGFDPAFSKLSLGHQVVHHAIREASREGAHTFDFLRGQEDYKYRWGAEDRLNRRRRLQHTP